MGRRPDRQRVQAAQLLGAVAGLRDVIVLDPDRQRRHREQWPELWARIDAVLAAAEGS